MNHNEIRELYDNDPQMTLRDLSTLTELNQQELFFILTCEDEEVTV